MSSGSRDATASILTIRNIDDWLPASFEQWPLDVITRVSEISQGTVVEEPPFFYFADPSRAIWRRTTDYAVDSSGPEVIESGPESSPRFGIVTSQTCDIAEDGRERPIFPWVQVAPVYERSDLNGGIRKLLARGAGPQYFYHLPAFLDGFWVADLRIEYPLEKSWLATCEVRNGFETDEQRRKFGRYLGARRERPAFAKTIVEGIQQPLVAGLRDLKAASPELFARMDLQVDEIGVRADNHLEPRSVELTVILRSEIDGDVDDWWRRWWDSTRERAELCEINLLPLDIRLAQDISVADYKQMTVMTLSRVSPE